MGHVLVIVGPPVSGKSTLLRQRAETLRAQGREPICIDYDALAVALGSQRTHGHAEHFTAVAQRARGMAIRAALEAAKAYDCDVLIVDSSPPAHRRDAYARAGAEVVTLEVDRAELHRRADAERPAEWHRLIDEWSPEQETAGWAWSNASPRKPWRKTPGYRKHAKGSTYERLRRGFLAGKTNCECGCGQPFVTDAPCTHPRCLKRGTGCMFHAQYPTVQHTVHLVNGGPSLDVSTWAAWASACNTGDGARVGNARRGRRPAQGDARASTYTDPAYGT